MFKLYLSEYLIVFHVFNKGLGANTSKMNTAIVTIYTQS